MALEVLRQPEGVTPGHASQRTEWRLSHIELLGPIFADGLVGKHGVSPVRTNATRQLVDRFTQRAEPLLKMTAGCKPLRQAAKTVEGFRRVHHAVLSGSVWVGQLPGEAKPYSSLVVRDAEITLLLASDEYVTIGELSRRTGLNKDAIYEMMRAGLLPHFPALDIKSGVTIRVLTHAVAESAEAEFIMLRQLASGSPRRAGTLKRKLSAVGVVPVSSSSNGLGNEIAVYRRAEVQAWL